MQPGQQLQRISTSDFTVGAKTTIAIGLWINLQTWDFVFMEGTEYAVVFVCSQAKPI